VTSLNTSGPETTVRLDAKNSLAQVNATFPHQPEPFVEVPAFSSRTATGGLADGTTQVLRGTADASIAGSVFSFMLEYQKLLNKEAREDKRTERGDAQRDELAHMDRIVAQCIPSGRPHRRRVG
jgi:hypothetical protein